MVFGIINTGLSCTQQCIMTSLDINTVHAMLPITNISMLSNTTSSPEWIPIRSWSFVSGMCRIVKDRMAESRWRDMEAISPACWSPLRMGRPDTTMSDVCVCV